MNIVQSYWSRPSLSKSDCEYNRFGGGWLSEKYHAMSWAYSLSLIKKYNPGFKTIFYTDQPGLDWLINKMGLAYDEVHAELDVLDKYDPILWAIPKIYAYSRQQEPFIHVDGDVFLWQSLAGMLDGKSLFVQNIEINHNMYRDLLKEAGHIFTGMPDFISNLDVAGEIISVNAGVLGGNDMAFIQQYCKTVFDFVNANHSSIINSAQKSAYNMFYEQLFFAQHALQYYGSTDCMHTFVHHQEGNMYNLTRFGLVPQLYNYMHMIGEAKSIPALSMHMEQRFAYDFPKLHRHISSIYAEPPRYYYVRGTGSAQAASLHLSSCIAEGRLDGCYRLVQQLTGRAAASPAEIEAVLEAHFDDPAFYELWDLYQLESACLKTSGLCDKPAGEEWNYLYNYSPKDFLDLTFALDADICKVVYMYYTWETWPGNDGLSWCTYRTNPGADHVTATPVPWLLTYTHDGLKIMELSNWFKILGLLDEQPLAGREIFEQLLNSDVLKVKGDFEENDIYFFLTTQFFIHKRINILESKTMNAVA